MYTEENLGNGPEKFKWWNMVLESFSKIEDIALFGTPSSGDVLTYWDKKQAQAGAYVYSGSKWDRVTTDYFANTGKVRHPSYEDDPRVLTWKSRSKLQPSWVKADYFKSHKSKLASSVIISLDEYNRMIFSDKRPGGNTISFAGDGGSAR